MSNEPVIKPDAARLCVLEQPTFINERLATFLSAANAKGLACSRFQIGQAAFAGGLRRVCRAQPAAGCVG